MLGNIQVLRAKREAMRANILMVLYTAHPYAATEQTILLTLRDAGEEQLVQDELRRDLEYLSEKELIRVHDKERNAWRCELTAYGIDVVEGAKKTPPGIAKLFS